MLTQNTETSYRHTKQNGFSMVNDLEEVYGGKGGLPKGQDRRIGSEVQR